MISLFFFPLFLRLVFLQGLAMFVGSLCHDLDHRGKTNQFMVRSASPLAEIYSTSTMEHHHFNMTVAILQVAFWLRSGLRSFVTLWRIRNRKFENLNFLIS